MRGSLGQLVQTRTDLPKHPILGRLAIGLEQAGSVAQIGQHRGQGEVSDVGAAEGPGQHGTHLLAYSCFEIVQTVWIALGAAAQNSGECWIEGRIVPR